MEDDVSGKLELLFAHLSINNITHVRPILIDAIDEYQCLREKLSFDDKKNVNFIKTLLWHAEREDWAEARGQLHGAQKAYQEYLLKGIKTPTDGYAQIHGKRCAQSPQSSPRAITSSDFYMFKNDEIERLHENGSDRLRWAHLQDRIRIGRHYDGRVSSQSIEEQGPSPRPSRDKKPLLHNDDYPGTYHKPTNRKPNTIKQALEKAITNEPGKQTDTNKFDEHDPNRPTRIVDAFASLYRLEWSTAYTALKGIAITETTAIACLLKTFIEAYNLCIEESHRQVLEFQSAALNIITDGKYTQEQRSILTKTGDSNIMVKFRQDIADLSVRRLQDIFLTKVLPVITRKHDIKPDDKLDVYARECIVVAWRMAIQDPPLHIYVSSGDVDFDDRIYKPYRYSGTRVLYQVWPILRLYADGPLLCKGVAEGDGRH